MDQLDVTYQRVFMASPLQDGLYQPSPAQERYYDIMTNSLIESNVQSDGTISNEELHKAITLLKYEKEAEHERNMLNITQVDDYKSPWKNKDATTANDTVNDLAYTFLNSWNDDEIYLSKQVDTIKYPIKDTHVHDTSVGTANVDPVVTGVGIIGRGGAQGY